MQKATEESSWTIDPGSQGTSSVGSQLLDNFRASKEYRQAFVEEHVASAIAAQIRLIREQRKIQRPEFARMLGKAPSWIFRLEDPNEPPPTVSTLLQVAKAYDVALEIRFTRFTALLDDIDHLTPETFEVPSFDEEMEQLERLEKIEAEAIESGKLRCIFSDGHGFSTDPEPPGTTGYVTEAELLKLPPGRETRHWAFIENAGTKVAYAR